MVFLALSRLFGYLYAQAPLCLVERISGDHVPQFLILWNCLGVISSFSGFSCSGSLNGNLLSFRSLSFFGFSFAFSH